MTESNIDFDLDYVLNLEDQFYEESFKEALKKGENHSNRDGKQFGIQTGFQRFILIGALNKVNILIEQTLDQSNELSNSKNKTKLNTKKIIKSLNEIQKLINQFYSSDSDKLVKTSNIPTDVDLYEKNIKLIRSKIKSLYSQLGYKTLYPEIEKTCRITAGDIPDTQINGTQDDMW